MPSRLIVLLCLAVLGGCMHRTHTMAAPAVNIKPLEISDATFTTRGPSFGSGLSAAIQLCVGPDGRIVSASVVQSSGEKRFDDFVLTFARQVHVQPRRENGKPVLSCDTVRVEVNHFPHPGLSLGTDNVLG
jgi:TonB family protein